MRLPAMHRVFRVAVVILLLEIVHKLSTLQRLMELQDGNDRLDNLMEWALHDHQMQNADLQQNQTSQKVKVLFSPQMLVASGGSRTNSSNGTDICRIPPSEGPEGSMGFQALTKIQIADDSSSLRLLCIVVTDSTHHVSRTLPAILQTYAPACDGFLAVSSESVANEDVVKIVGNTEWERLTRIWKHVQNYKDAKGPFDAFHFGIESTYLVPSNMRRMLATYSKFKSELHPMYLGGAVVASRKDPQTRHCGGKSGYTLNRAALQLADRLSDCSRPHDPLPIDQELAHCLHQLANIQCVKTVDQDSALRYIEFGLDYQAKFSSKTKKYAKRTPLKVKPLADYHGIYIRDGLQGIASDAVAFSMVDVRGNNTSDQEGYTVADAIRRVDAILKRKCKAEWDDPPVLALAADGTPGYIHDATYLRRHPPSLREFPKGDDFGVCELSPGSGREGPVGHRGLKKIRIMTTDVPKKRVLCMIYTHSRRHSTRLRAISETYGPRCDGFLAASNETDPTIGAANLLHEGPEAYENMWLKVRSTWKYAYQHYLNDYDLFHIGGDDHYLIPENLVYMASVGSWKGPWNFSEPLFLGGSMVDFPMTNVRYCGGGSGYTLNRAALKLLVEQLFDTYHCRPHYQASDEDRIISDCFRSVGVYCMDTNDAKNETRYHQASVNFHANWTRDQPAVWHPGPLDRVHGIASKEGLGQISESSVSFHLKGMPKGSQDRGMRRYHAILHGLCNGRNLTVANRVPVDG